MKKRIVIITICVILTTSIFSSIINANTLKCDNEPPTVNTLLDSSTTFSPPYDSDAVGSADHTATFGDANYGCNKETGFIGGSINLSGFASSTPPMGLTEAYQVIDFNIASDRTLHVEADLTVSVMDIDLVFGFSTTKIIAICDDDVVYEEEIEPFIGLDEYLDVLLMIFGLYGNIGNAISLATFINDLQGFWYNMSLMRSQQAAYDYTISFDLNDLDSGSHQLKIGCNQFSVCPTGIFFATKSSFFGGVSNITIYDLYLPILECDNWHLEWHDVTTSESLSGDFEVFNVGDAGTELDWEVCSWPDWGSDWSFDPDEGTGLTTDDETSVQVNFTSPEQRGDYNGYIRVVNSEDNTDYEDLPCYLYMSDNQPPNVPSFVDPPSEANVGDNVAFHVVATDPDNDGVDYYFDWGDGSNTGWDGYYDDSGQEVVCTHSWGSVGTYEVKLKAKDEYGLESGFNTTSITIIQSNNPPVDPDKPYISLPGATGAFYEFCSSGYDPDCDHIKFGWDWDNDDRVDDWGDTWRVGSPNDPPEDCFRHTWDSAGTYYIKVRLKDASGAKSGWSESLEVVVESNPISVDSGGPYEGKPDEDITFTASASGGFKPYNFSWSFDGDNSTFEVEGKTVYHNWDGAGTYCYPEVRVIDSRGQVDKEKFNVVIKNCKSKEIVKFIDIIDLIKNPFFRQLFLKLFDIIE